MIFFWVHLNLLYLQKLRPASFKKSLAVSGFAGIFNFGDFLTFKGSTFQTLVLPFELWCRREEAS